MSDPRVEILAPELQARTTMIPWATVPDTRKTFYRTEATRILAALDAADPRDAVIEDLVKAAGKLLHGLADERLSAQAPAPKRSPRVNLAVNDLHAAIARAKEARK